MRKISQNIWIAILATLSAFVGTVVLAISASAGSSLPGCFGHDGTQLGKHIAYECIFQPPHLGGALYWSANESNFNWNKHPGTGLLWVEASTLHPTPDANPPNPFQVFWVGIPVTVNSFNRIVPTTVIAPAPPNAYFCNVIDPGVSNNPTQCEVEGNVQTMPTQVQDSYNQFAATMKAANLPFCAWSDHPVPNENACDIDA